MFFCLDSNTISLVILHRPVLGLVPFHRVHNRLDGGLAKMAAGLVLDSHVFVPHLNSVTGSFFDLLAL